MKRSNGWKFFSVLCFVALAVFHTPVLAQDWQEDFNLKTRTLSDTGKSDFFILMPGYRAVLESGNMKLVITVTNETKVINGITTRVVEEWEEKNGELYEIARNYYAIDTETGDAFYFGEDVDFYKKGKVVRHTGAWMADEEGNRPGLIMPGDPEIGMKYYQELAPGKAMDRAEVMSLSETFETPAGEFNNCLKTKESSKIKTFFFFTPTEYKTYAPGIGLIQDGKMKLVSYGFVDESTVQNR